MPHKICSMTQVFVVGGHKCEEPFLTWQRPTAKFAVDNWMVSNLLPSGNEFHTIQLSSAGFVTGLSLVIFPADSFLPVLPAKKLNDGAIKKTNSYIT